MANVLNPGNFTSDPLNYSAFDSSMADLIDHELDRLMRLDAADPTAPSAGLSFDNSDRDVRARRRLFVAIARGVLLYLARSPDAIDVTVAALDHTVHPVIHVTGGP
jgi:hypothetical protein